MYTDLKYKCTINSYTFKNTQKHFVFNINLYFYFYFVKYINYVLFWFIMMIVVLCNADKFWYIKYVLLHLYI